MQVAMSLYSIVCWWCLFLRTNFCNKGWPSFNVTTVYKSCCGSVVEVSAFFRVERIREHIFRCEKWVERLRYTLQLEKPYITLISFHGGLALFPFSVYVVPGGKGSNKWQSDPSGQKAECYQRVAPPPSLILQQFCGRISISQSL